MAFIPKVPYLVQYVSTGTYFGRVKIEGKTFRECLQTEVFTTAKLLLGDFIKNRIVQQPRGRHVSAARIAYELELDADHTLREASKLYRHRCIKALL